MTIRRDLEYLEKAGRITRTHGGAVANGDVRGGGSEEEESYFDRRLLKNAGSKEAIGRVAATLVGSAQSIGLDVGTTVLTAARQLAGRNDVRFFTNNLRAALALAGTGSPVYILGGEVRVPELSVVAAPPSSWSAAIFSTGCFWASRGSTRTDCMISPPRTARSSAPSSTARTVSHCSATARNSSGAP